MNPSGDVVERLAGRGDGVTASGRHVPLAAPGDRISTGADGRVAVIPGANHVEPPCRHFPECGGCQLQHVTEPELARFVFERVRAALRGPGLDGAELQPVHLSPPRARRRASLRATREGGAIRLGFNVEGSHRLIDLAECHVLAPELFGLVAPLRALLTSLAPPRGAVGITLTLSDTGVEVVLANVVAERLEAIERLTAFADAQDLARLCVEGPAGIDVVVERRAPMVTNFGVRVYTPPAPFLQPTADGEAALRAAVLAAVVDAARVADLFAGVGTFTLALASGGAKVTAADASGPALAALAAAARRLSVQVAHRDLFRRPFTAAELAGFDAVVFDPPRAGAAAQSAEIAKSRVPVVVAVSCNPNTFARDVATLAAGGYRVGRVWPVGQFRWSTHVELVAEFRR